MLLDLTRIRTIFPLGVVHLPRRTERQVPDDSVRNASTVCQFVIFFSPRP